MTRAPFAILSILVFATAAGCATSGPRSTTAAPQTDAPAWYDAERAGALVGRARAEAFSATVADAAAVERARAALGAEINGAIDALAASLRPAVIALGDDAAARRFENARHLAVSAALRAADSERIETYLEPDGRYSAFALLAADADDPALRLHDELRRIDGLAQGLAANDAWRALASRAAARRAEVASDSPLPPVGGR